MSYLKCSPNQIIHFHFYVRWMYFSSSILPNGPYITYITSIIEKARLDGNERHTIITSTEPHIVDIAIGMYIKISGIALLI